jgi:hypothetical protein
VPLLANTFPMRSQTSIPTSERVKPNVAITPSPNLSSSLAKAKLMTTPSNIAKTPATVMTALCWERRLMRCSRRAIGISEAV